MEHITISSVADEENGATTYTISESDIALSGELSELSEIVDGTTTDEECNTTSTGIVSSVVANTTAIATLNGSSVTKGSVAYAIATVQAIIEETIGTASVIGEDGTVTTYVTGLVAHIETLKDVAEFTTDEIDAWFADSID